MKLAKLYIIREQCGGAYYNVGAFSSREKAEKYREFLLATGDVDDVDIDTVNKLDDTIGLRYGQHTYYACIVFALRIAGKWRPVYIQTRQIKLNDKDEFVDVPDPKYTHMCVATCYAQSAARARELAEVEYTKFLDKAKRR